MLKKIVKKIKKTEHKVKGYQFKIDQVSDELIDGWAFKIDNDELSPEIQIRNNNVILYSIRANEYRPDLQSAGIGTGKNGFRIKPSSLDLENDIDSIDIFIDGHKANELPIPLSLRVSNEAKVSRTPEHKVKKAESSDFQFYIDIVSSEKVVGWAKRRDSEKHRCYIELKLGSIVLGQDKADGFRHSIKDAEIGDGFYCFEIKPAIHLFPKNNVSCDLYIDNVKVQIKPIPITVDDEEFEKAKFEHEFANEISDFNKSVSKELSRISSEINKDNTNTMQVAMNNIASLSARVDVIEKVLTKHFSSK